MLTQLMTHRKLGKAVVIDAGEFPKLNIDFGHLLVQTSSALLSLALLCLFTLVMYTVSLRQ